MKKIILLIIAFTNVFAENKPKNDLNDVRLKTVVYRANDVIPVFSGFKQATLIDLGAGNEIQNVIAGDTESWLFDLTSDKTGILAKPVAESAKTNLIVITNNRKYFFSLNRTKEERKATYSIRFIYPKEELAKLKNKIDQKKRLSVNSDMSIEKTDPNDWNFGYVLKGDKNTAPYNIFDDGKFTYLEFGKKQIPAIFSVDSAKKESVINYHNSGKYIVIENVFQQLTFRNGVDSVCAYNKSYHDDNYINVAEDKLDEK